MTLITTDTTQATQDYSEYSAVVAGYDLSLEQAVLSMAANKQITSHALNQFYRVRQSLLNWIENQMASELTEANPTIPSPWDWQPFIDEADLRIGIIRIARNREIPIHDHPGANGLLLVLDGQVEINNFSVKQLEQSNKAKLAELTLTEQKVLKRDHFAVITAGLNNVHSLRCVNDVCLILDVLLTPYDEKHRTWYMPVAQQIDTRAPFNAFCVNKS